MSTKQTSITSRMRDIELTLSLPSETQVHQPLELKLELANKRAGTVLWSEVNGYRDLEINVVKRAEPRFS